MLHNRKYLKENRRELRHNLTPAEAELWKHLQGSQLAGRKFRRQHSIGNFILDFYCSSEKMAIELDVCSSRTNGYGARWNLETIR
ncbi:endonuclease domain-containing protein [Pontibacter sp. CAU 1760]